MRGICLEPREVASGAHAAPADQLDSATIITGAGSGLGRALAQSLANKGRPVVLVGRRSEHLLRTRAACLAAGGTIRKCEVVVADISEPGAADRVVDASLDTFGSIGALVNNAGFARFGGIENADPRDWERMLGINLLAPVALIRYAIPSLRRSRGVVVNVGSIGGALALPGRALYGASKAALAHVTRSLARELAPDIRVNAVIPGALDTEMYERLGLDDEAVRELRADMVRTTPLGRMGTVEDVVPWIELMLGPAGYWMTGSLLVVDGGRSC
jgi:NAD(P)-dependent dehydrogenase (short-subunit alcohol dehydrogenase family)